MPSVRYGRTAKSVTDPYEIAYVSALHKRRAEEIPALAEKYGRSKEEVSKILSLYQHSKSGELSFEAIEKIPELNLRQSSGNTAQRIINKGMALGLEPLVVPPRTISTKPEELISESEDPEQAIIEEERKLPKNCWDSYWQQQGLPAPAPSNVPMLTARRIEELRASEDLLKRKKFRAPKLPPLSSLPEEDLAWGAGWRTGFYSSPAEVAKCPFKDIYLARRWSAGLAAGAEGREEFDAFEEVEKGEPA